MIRMIPLSNFLGCKETTNQYDRHQTRHVWFARCYQGGVPTTEALFPSDPSLSGSTGCLTRRDFSASDRWTTGRYHGSAEVSRCRWIVGSLTRGTAFLHPVGNQQCDHVSPEIANWFTALPKRFFHDSQAIGSAEWDLEAQPLQVMMTLNEFSRLCKKADATGIMEKLPACDLVSLALPEGVGDLTMCQLGWLEKVERLESFLGMLATSNHWIWLRPTMGIRKSWTWTMDYGWLWTMGVPVQYTLWQSNMPRA